MVLRKIQALNIEENIILKNTLTDINNKKFHLEKTGRTTVPCLYINGEALFESSDIVQWLEVNHTKI